MPRLFLLIVLLCAHTSSVGETSQWPHENPDAWLLAFVDIETTGLTPGYHEAIDIGIVMTDIDGEQLAELFLRIQPEHPQRTDAGARAVNAFSTERWRELKALSVHDAVARIKSFHQSVAGERSVLMVAFNSQFDTAFLDHLFRAADSNWRELYHYFVLDVPSMAWGLGIKSLTGSSIASALDVEDEPHVAEHHTGITGARLNARLYRKLLTLRPAVSEKND